MKSQTHSIHYQTFAKTNRLKKSSIPYKQVNLNSKNLEFEKQDLKRKMNFHGVKNIENKMIKIKTKNKNINYENLI